MLQEWGNTENILEQPQLDPHMEYKNRPGTKKLRIKKKNLQQGQKLSIIVWKSVKNSTDKKLNTDNSKIVCNLPYFAICNKVA